METLKLAGTDLVLPRIALGTWAIGGWMWGGSDDRAAIRTIQGAIERGITLIDTAPVYGFGHSERLVGRALAENGLRQKALIATKAGLDWRGDEVFRNSSPARIRHEVEASLLRLRTDVIDLYQLHWPDDAVAIEETAAVMGELLREGKIRAIGVSNFSPAQMDRFRAVAPLHSVQPPYNLFERAAEADVLPYAERLGLAVLAYGPLCRGLLTGKITRDSRWGGDDLRRSDPKFQEPLLGQYLDAVAALERFAGQTYRKSVLALAVRWVLDRGRTVALWGARKPEQLDAVEEALGWHIGPVAMREIEEILVRTVRQPVGPEFMAPPERHAA